MSVDAIMSAGDSQKSETVSHTAEEYIESQLQLEADAREALPYQFDSCTRPLGALRQLLFACLTCNPRSDDKLDNPNLAGLCYSCSISCHGEHELVELFTKRDFECDCGTTRFPDLTPCTLRSNAKTGLKGNVVAEEPRKENAYNHNFAGRFCCCNETYDAETEKGTMFQCLGLGTIAEGGCGEDWYHPECLMGLSRSAPKKTVAASERTTKSQTATDLPTVAEESEQIGSINTADMIQDQDIDVALPPGFPAEDSFENLLCFKCVDANPWLKSYARQDSFIAVSKSPLEDAASTLPAIPGTKRKAEDSPEDTDGAIKRSRIEPGSGTVAAIASDVPAVASASASQTDASEGVKQIHHSLQPAQAGSINLFLKEDFRDKFCKCTECFPNLSRHPQLLEEEDSYEPPLTESDDAEANGGGSVSAGSLLERGEAALSTMDRMRAIEGVMAYNHLKDKVKSFLQPFAESGQAVGAEHVKSYFAKLRGDEEAIRHAAAGADGGDSSGSNRREQSGY